MNILNNIQNTNTGYNAVKSLKQAEALSQNKVKNNEYKPDVLDFLSEKVVNKNDLNDMVTTPRAIFKGYLCFTAGTTVNAIAGFIKHEKISNALKVLGSIVSVYGTYNFVKPYLIRNKELTKSEK